MVGSARAGRECVRDGWAKQVRPRSSAWIEHWDRTLEVVSSNLTGATPKNVGYEGVLGLDRSSHQRETAIVGCEPSSFIQEELKKATERPPLSFSDFINLRSSAPAERRSGQAVARAILGVVIPSRL